MKSEKHFPGLILTAGIGERLRPVTLKLAKPAVPFLNLPLMSFAWTWLQHLGVNEVTCNLHYLPDTVSRAFFLVARSAKNPGLRTNLSDETAKILGSSGAIFFAEKFLSGGDYFAFMNGDEVLLPSRLDVAKKLREVHEREKAFATLLVTKHADVGVRFGGVFADRAGRVRGFKKASKGTPDAGFVSAYGSDASPYHWTGLQLISREIFKYTRPGESNIFYDVMTEAIAAGEKVCVLEDACTWLETGNEKDFLLATGEILKILASAVKKNGKGLSANEQWLMDMFAVVQPNYDLQQQIAVANGSCVFTGVSSEVAVARDGFVVVDDQISVKGSGRMQNVVLINSEKKPVTFTCNENVSNKIIVC